MNPAWWSASAEMGGLIFSLMSSGGLIAFALLRAQFVTRRQHARSHSVLSERIVGVENTVRLKVDKDEMKEINDRLFSMEKQVAAQNALVSESNALVRSGLESSKSIERQVNMLIENELRSERVSR